MKTKLVLWQIISAILAIFTIGLFCEAYGLEKNVNSQKWTIFCFDDTDNSAKTGDSAQITGSIWKDGSEDVIADGNPTETAHGQYIFDLDQEESNCDHCVMDAVSSTPDIQCVGVPMGRDTDPPNANTLTIANGAVDSNITYVQEDAVADGGDGVLNGNMVKISGDSTSADNLELQYDTTGLAGDTFPATQSQLSKIANVGAAVNTPASSYTLTTGTQSSGTYASTEELDGTNHEHTNTNGSMDLYYEFVIGSGTPVSVIVTGYLNGNNDDLEVHGYDWVSSSWKQVGALEGKASSTNEVNAYELFVNMVGFASNEGIVRVRFTDGIYTLSSATLAIDQIYLSFALGAAGYDNGAVWLDTTASNTNTVVGIDGTAQNPVSTIAAANTLLASTNLNRIEVAPGSSVTLAASQEGQVLCGYNWTLALGGQSVSNSYICGARSVTGICTGAITPIFASCMFGNATLPPSHLIDCGFDGTITMGSAGEFTFDACHSMVGGTSTPILDFGSGLNASEVNMRHYSGGIDLRYMGAGTSSYNMSLEGDGQLIINANCSATSNIAIRGNFKITNNASGISLTYDDDTTDINTLITQVGTAGAGLTDLGGMSTGMKAETKSEAADALTAYDPPTKTEMDAAHALLATPAEVNAEVVDCLSVDEYNLVGQGAPPNNPTIIEMGAYPYKAWRNKTETTSTTIKVYNDAGTTVDAKSTTSDDGATFTKSEYVTGP